MQEIAEALAKVWLVKIRGTLGPGPGDDKGTSILNHIVRWEKDHLRYEADPRHVEKLAILQTPYDSGDEARYIEYHCWTMWFQVAVFSP